MFTEVSESRWHFNSIGFQLWQFALKTYSDNGVKHLLLPSLLLLRGVILCYLAIKYESVLPLVLTCAEECWKAVPAQWCLKQHCTNPHSQIKTNETGKRMRRQRGAGEPSRKCWLLKIPDIDLFYSVYPGEHRILLHFGTICSFIFFSFFFSPFGTQCCYSLIPICN